MATLFEIARHELNGNLVEIVPSTDPESPKGTVNDAQNMSAQENGYLCIAGVNLAAANETERVILGVAINGVLVTQNAYDA